jgi:hypothetical protein
MVVTDWTCLQHASLKLGNVRSRVPFCLSFLTRANWHKINNALVLRPVVVCALHLWRLSIKVDYVVVIVVKAVVGRRAAYTGRSSLMYVLLPYGC